MHAKGRALFLTVLGLFASACDGSCGRAGDRRALGESMAAHDCPPDVAVCVAGEGYLSVGGVQPEGEPCRQVGLGLCERGCVAEGVAVAYDQATPELARQQLCAPPPGALVAVPASPAACAAGEILCRDGVVQICGQAAARCARGCATADTVTDEALTLDQATRLLCRR